MKDNFLIPASPKEDAFNRIKQFLSEGDITLLPKEEMILKRWNYADKLLVQRKYSEQQIIEKIVEQHRVSSYTARNDIYHAQALYASVIKANKKYLLHHHSENILLKIERFSNDKSLVYLVPKLMEAYTKAVLAIPDELNKEPMQAPVMIFKVIEGQAVTVSKTYEEAIASMKKRQAEKEFTDYEEVDDE